jgi:hypothetical protein
MRPLVRLMMLSGVTFPLLAEAIRQLFVEIAAEDVLTNPKTRTDSRISLLTGVHRKEIRRLRQMPPADNATPGGVTLVSQIVTRWTGTARFVDPDGRPRILPRSSNEKLDSNPSFDELVESVTTDVRPRAVLDELLDHGIVFLDATERVRLNSEAFIPRPGREEQLFYFARNLHDHIAAAVANISAATTAPFLDRSVHYDRLTPEQVAQLREYARTAAIGILLDVNRHAIELTAANPDPDPKEPGRINFGIYLFDEIEPPQAHRS